MNLLMPQKITSPDIFVINKAALLPPRNPKGFVQLSGETKPFFSDFDMWWPERIL
jgi:hypothetical protein